MGSLLNHATTQLDHKLPHQAAFHQHSTGAPLSNPLLNCPEVTRQQCEGFQRATLRVKVGIRARTNPTNACSAASVGAAAAAAPRPPSALVMATASPYELTLNNTLESFTYRCSYRSRQFHPRVTILSLPVSFPCNFLNESHCPFSRLVEVWRSNTHLQADEVDVVDARLEQERIEPQNARRRVRRHRSRCRRRRSVLDGAAAAAAAALITA